TARPPVGEITGAATPRGYLVSHRQNDTFRVVNRLLAAGEDVYWPRKRDVAAAGAASMYVAAGAETRALLKTAASELGLDFAGTDAPPPADALKLRRVRLGLVDQIG